MCRCNNVFDSKYIVNLKRKYPGVRLGDTFRGCFLLFTLAFSQLHFVKLIHKRRSLAVSSYPHMEWTALKDFPWHDMFTFKMVLPVTILPLD